MLYRLRQCAVIPALIVGLLIGRFFDQAVQAHAHVSAEHGIAAAGGPGTSAPGTAPRGTAAPARPAGPPAPRNLTLPRPEEYPEVQFPCLCHKFPSGVEIIDAPPTKLPCGCKRHMLFSLDLIVVEPDLSTEKSRMASFLEMHTREYVHIIGRMYKGKEVHVMRKLWEHYAIARAVEDAGLATEGRRGLGFAVGKEPLGSWFASLGARVFLSDKPRYEEEWRADGKWEKSGQYARGLMSAHWPSIISDTEFMDRAQFKPLDMAEIDPEVLRGEYDFVWSCGAMEHIDDGWQPAARFMLAAMKALKPGGVAVHTTEVRIDEVADGHWSGSDNFYSRSDMKRIAELLTQHGYVVAPLEFRTGKEGIVDRIPFRRPLQNHVFLQQGSVAHTSYVLIIHKP